MRIFKNIYIFGENMKVMNSDRKMAVTELWQDDDSTQKYSQCK